VSFDAAWALELAISLAGFGLAIAMTDLPPAAEEPEEDDDDASASFAALRARVPWALIAPAAMVGTLGSIGELFAQTTPRSGLGAPLVALAIAGALALEALGAALVARGVVPMNARALGAVSLAALAGFASLALGPAMLVPGVLAIFHANGIAPAIRSALIQERARDGERATLASAASAVDLLAKTLGLPLAAWLATALARR
jgi:hypothetical protein